MIEYKGKEKIDHGAVTKDFTRRRRQAVAQVQNMIETAARKKGVSIETLVGNNRKLIPTNIKPSNYILRKLPGRQHEENSVPLPNVGSTENIVTKGTFAHPKGEWKLKPGFSYWFKHQGKCVRTVWQSTKSDEFRLKQRNVYRTEEEASTHKF